MSVVKRLALALFLAALLLPAGARAGIAFGVTEDAAKYSSDGGASIFAHLRDLGMTENAVSVQWDPERPTTIIDKTLLDRMVPTAARYGVNVVFAVYFTRPNAVSTTPDGAGKFAAFLRVLAHAYPQVKEFVVGNEPNYGVFWQPQYDRAGRPLAGAAYEDLLARSYDALKSVDPAIEVIGMGLSPRGNDRPFSSTPSTSPVLFLRDVGNAYRRSGRSRPLMDSFAYHPYPPSSVAAPTTTSGWPLAGLADLSRIKQAMWDGFNGTGQPTFENGLRLRVTEIGWQASVSGASAAAYRGVENVPTTDEATQAKYYAQVVRQLACDPVVADVLFFHLVDEANLAGFQSGMVRADGSVRPSYGAVRSAIAAGGCASPQVWRHTDGVVGAAVSFGAPAADGVPSVHLTADEGATYRATVVPVAGDPSTAEREAIESKLASGAFAAAGPMQAYRGAAPDLQAPSGSGTFVQAVLVSAATNPARTSFFLGEPFTIGAPSTADASEAAPAKTLQPVTKPAEPSAPPPAAAPPPPAEPPATAPAPPAAAPTPAAAAPAAPAPSVFAVTQSPKPKAAPKAKPSSVRFAGGSPKKKHVPEVHASADFRKLPRASGSRPGRSEVSALDGGEAPRRHASRTAAPVSLDSRRHGSSSPLLFALLLAGAALSAVLSVRFLSR